MTEVEHGETGCLPAELATFVGSKGLESSERLGRQVMSLVVM